MKKNIFKTLAVTVLSAVSLTAWAAEPVSYVYYTVDGTTATMHNDGSQTSYTVVTDQTAWSDGWYVVNSNVTIADRITVSGTVNLILCDNATLTASKGITVTGENTLNIYAQSEGTGVLTATGNTGGAQTGGGAGIGGNSGGQGGTVNIYGGTITATGGNGGQYAGGGAGIGGGGLGWKNSGGQGGTVNIYGGTVTATGGNAEQYAGGGAGIGGGGFGWSNDGTGYCAGGTVNIYGGTVIATGGNKYTGIDSADGAGIGAGGKGHGSGTTTDGTLTLGKGVTMEVSSDNSTWTDYNGSTRARYMKSSAAPTTSVATPTLSPADAAKSNIWYDLNGRHYQGKPTMQGVYINNHQKYFVK